MKKLQQIPSLQEILDTHSAINAMIHRTPVLTSQSINELTGSKLFFKCENFQKIGAFKMRGAASAALRLSSREKEKGLATHSSGNHAQAVAKSAQLLNIPAYIVMPENAPTIKQAATKGYGAEIFFSGSTIASRETKMEEVIQQTNATFIHPYNDYNVIAGQATAALELLEEVPDLEVVIPPVGGGGLASGTCLSCHYLKPSVTVIGAEPKAADDAYRSLQHGAILGNDTIDTIADGLRTNLGPKTFDILSQHLDQIITVSEERIIEAMRLIWERMKIIIEPSCAVPLAAVLTAPQLFANKKVGLILTGGNVDVSNLPF